MRPIRYSLALASLLGALVALAACQLQRCSEGAACSISKTGSGPSPVAGISPTPQASPSPLPSATPKDPCNPVVSLAAYGPTSVQIGSVIAFDLTPATPDGPLEGVLDYCNASRTPNVEHASPNLRCVGSCGGWRPQFLATAVGPFEVQFRLGGVVSAVFSGTVTR